MTMQAAIYTGVSTDEKVVPEKGPASAQGQFGF